MQGKSGTSRTTRVIMSAAGFLEYALQYASPDWHMVPGLVGNVCKHMKKKLKIGMAQVYKLKWTNIVTFIMGLL